MISAVNSQVGRASGGEPDGVGLPWYRRSSQSSQASSNGVSSQQRHWRISLEHGLLTAPADALSCCISVTRLVIGYKKLPFLLPGLIGQSILLLTRTYTIFIKPGELLCILKNITSPYNVCRTFGLLKKEEEDHGSTSDL